MGPARKYVKLGFGHVLRACPESVVSGHTGLAAFGMRRRPLAHGHNLHMAYSTDLDSEYQPALAKGLSFELLNALLPEPRGWRRVAARKAHEDLFGDWVREGHDYFVRDSGPAFGDVTKLSQASMDRVLVSVFFANEGLRDFAAKEMERRKAAMMAEMQASIGKVHGA